MATSPRATIQSVRTMGDFDTTEFTDVDILNQMPVAHSIVMFQMKSDWASNYTPEETDHAENILAEAETNLVIGRLYRVKAEKQLDVKDEDAFTIGNISIQPGGAQQRIFNKDYQFLADKYELQAQTLINLVLPSNTQVFFKVSSTK